MSNVRIEFIEDTFQGDALSGTIVLTTTSIIGTASMREECRVIVEEHGKQMLPAEGERGLPIAMHVAAVQESVSNMMSILYALRRGTKPYIWVEA